MAALPVNEASLAGGLLLAPIGYVRTDATAKVDAPRQPAAALGREGRVELLPGRNLEHAVEDLAGCERIWLIFWLHLNASWRPKVLPPRGSGKRRGVLATRSPYRPNPLGLSAVRLVRVEGLTLQVLDVDMVDGTPVLDIKPYVAYTDAHPDASVDWLQPASADSPADPLTAYRVCLSALAREQLAWIEGRAGDALNQRICSLLSADPFPRPYRRIRREGAGFRMAVGAWRVWYRVDGQQVEVDSLTSGYSAAQCLPGQAQSDPALELHREFQTHWPSRQ